MWSNASCWNLESLCSSKTVHIFQWLLYGSIFSRESLDPYANQSSHSGSPTCVLPSVLSSCQLQAGHRGFQRRMSNLCVHTETEVVRNENVMLIGDNIIRNLLNGFLVCVLNVSPCNKTAPHHVSSCAVNAIMIRPITALTVLKEIKHLGDSFSATLIELKWCC